MINLKPRAGRVRSSEWLGRLKLILSGGRLIWGDLGAGQIPIRLLKTFQEPIRPWRSAERCMEVDESCRIQDKQEDDEGECERGDEGLKGQLCRAGKSAEGAVHWKKGYDQVRIVSEELDTR